MGGNHERPLTRHQRVIEGALRNLTRLVEIDVLIALLHLVLTAAAVFGVIHAHGAAE